MRLFNRSLGDWKGVVILPLIVVGCIWGCFATGGCSITSMRLAIEEGKGSIQADTIGLKAKGQMDTAVDATVDADNANVPLDLGGE